MWEEYDKLVQNLLRCSPVVVVENKNNDWQRDHRPSFFAYLSASAKAILESLGPQRGHIKDNKNNRGQTDKVEESLRPGKDVVCRWFE